MSFIYTPDLRPCYGIPTPSCTRGAGWICSSSSFLLSGEGLFTMKIICWGMLIWVMLGFVGSADAQDVPPPYTDDDVIMVYYEDENPQNLDSWLVCLEAFIHLNPHININNIPYGTKMYLPRNQRCYDYQGYYYDYWGYGNPKRLKFYENGQWLDEPYYSDTVTYLNFKGIKREKHHLLTVEDIARHLNVCVDELLAENYLLAYHFEEYKRYYRYSMDIFVPDNNIISPCRNYRRERQKIKRYGYYTVLPISPLKPPVENVIRFSSFYNLPRTLAYTHGICIEEVIDSTIRAKFYSLNARSEPVDIYLSPDAPKCYNEYGQRLKYYDEHGQRLEKPVYSDLPVYWTNMGDTIPSIAQKFGVCIIDLLRVNQFPDIPYDIWIEVFIPPPRPCPADLQAIQIPTADLRIASFITNICFEIMKEFNAESQNRVFLDTSRGAVHPYNLKSHWFIVKVGQPPCYKRYTLQGGDSIYQAEKILNTCVEEFSLVWFRDNNFITYNFEETISRSFIYAFAPIDAPPCYNEYGHRLIYPPKQSTHYGDWRDIINRETPTYSTLSVYLPELRETVYDISKQFNVCVHDLFEINPHLQRRIPRNRYVFIPQTRPCYDDETGMPLIYEDENGNPLPEPIVSEYLIHYGAPTFGYLTYYYNVCSNRISDANANKRDENGNARYLGYIIPTDRPRCYDENWRPADYVCYDQPVDFDADYRHISLTFDIDGTHCYDLKNPDAVIWYKGKPYKVQYYKGTIFESRLFTAWCFGLSMQDIYAINADKEFLPILPLYTRAIPMPTRECYLENPSILEGKITHSVEYGETLISIAQKYDVPYPMISVANQLGVNNVIWVGQKLIIPASPQSDDVWWLIPLWLFWGWWCVHIGRMVITEIREKRGWK